MKNLVFKVFILLIAFVAFSSTDAIAQKKKTYLKNIQVAFEGTGHTIEFKSRTRKMRHEGADLCKMEGKKCEFRVSVVVDGKMRGVMGKDGVYMQGTSNYIDDPEDYPVGYKNSDAVSRVTKYGTRWIPMHKENNDKKIYIGEYSSNEEFEIKWDFWEDDSIVSSQEWDFGWGDSEHHDIYSQASASRGHIKYNKKEPKCKCMQVTYDVVQE